MVYDCFSFYNEMDILEMRLNILKDVVDKFVLVEAVETHTGAKKPLFYEENKSRYSDFSEKIIHIVVDRFPDIPSEYSLRQAAWLRENFQRNQAVRGLVDACDADTVICTDVDEIPRPESICRCVGRTGPIALEQDAFYYYLNCKNYIRPKWSFGRVMSYAKLIQTPWLAEMSANEFVDPLVNDGPSLTCCRLTPAKETVRNAGWHFSYLGGAEKVLQKLRSIAHTECDTTDVHDERWFEEQIAAGNDVTGGVGCFFAVPTDARLPKYVVDNLDRYRELILPCDSEYLRQTRWRRLGAWTRRVIRFQGAKLIPSIFKPFLFRIYLKVSRKPILA